MAKNVQKREKVKQWNPLALEWDWRVLQPS